MTTPIPLTGWDANGSPVSGPRRGPDEVPDDALVPPAPAIVSTGAASLLGMPQAEFDRQVLEAATTPVPDPPAVAAFYGHLDACAQCREHPFDLCAKGAKLLAAVGAALHVPEVCDG